MMTEATQKYKGHTLFLDRDGVLNRRPGGGYVCRPEDFHWIDGSLEAVVDLSGIFRYVFVVTNQQGVGKGLMTHNDLQAVHRRMLQDVEEAGGRIDQVYAATGIRHADSFNRKPAEGMAFEAMDDFPGIILDKAWMVGDTVRDMLFGHRLGMSTVLISQQQITPGNLHHLVDYRFACLSDFAGFIIGKNTNM